MPLVLLVPRGQLVQVRLGQVQPALRELPERALGSQVPQGQGAHLVVPESSSPACWEQAVVGEVQTWGKAGLNPSAHDSPHCKPLE